MVTCIELIITTINFFSCPVCSPRGAVDPAAGAVSSVPVVEEGRATDEELGL